MTMTRQHFELIASTFKQVYEANTQGQHDSQSEAVVDGALTALAYHLANALGETNALFNTERFLKACGVKQ